MVYPYQVTLKMMASIFAKLIWKRSQFGVMEFENYLIFGFELGDFSKKNCSFRFMIGENERLSQIG